MTVPPILLIVAVAILVIAAATAVVALMRLRRLLRTRVITSECKPTVEGDRLTWRVILPHELVPGFVKSADPAVDFAELDRQAPGSGAMLAELQRRGPALANWFAELCDEEGRSLGVEAHSDPKMYGASFWTVGKLRTMSKERVLRALHAPCDRTFSMPRAALPTAGPQVAWLKVYACKFGTNEVLTTLWIRSVA